MMKTAERNVWRPAHLHVRVDAPGCEMLTTELFIEGDEYLDNDAVFGVKDSLVINWGRNDSQEKAEKLDIASPFYEIEFDVVLNPAVAAAQAQAAD